MHALGRWIQQQLDSRGWTRADLARRHEDLSQQLLYKLINDPSDREHLDQTPQKRTLRALAEAFNVSLDEVLLVAAKSIGAPVEGLTVAPLSTATIDELIEEIRIRLRSTRPKEVPGDQEAPASMTLPPNLDVELAKRDDEPARPAGSVTELRPSRVTRAARRAPRTDDEDQD